MSGVATAAVLIGAAVSAYSMYSQGQQAASAARENAAVARQNADIQNQNAIVAENQGANTAATQLLKARMANSTLRASAGSNGLVSDTGNLGTIQDQNTSEGEFNALTATNDAARTAWGYRVNATNDVNSANMDEWQAKNDSFNSYLGAGATLITGAGNSAATYAKVTGNNPFGAPNKYGG